MFNPNNDPRLTEYVLPHPGPRSTATLHLVARRNSPLEGTELIVMQTNAGLRAIVQHWYGRSRYIRWNGNVEDIDAAIVKLLEYGKPVPMIYYEFDVDRGDGVIAKARGKTTFNSRKYMTALTFWNGAPFRRLQAEPTDDLITLADQLIPWAQKALADRFGVDISAVKCRHKFSKWVGKIKLTPDFRMETIDDNSSTVDEAGAAAGSEQRSTAEERVDSPSDYQEGDGAS